MTTKPKKQFFTCLLVSPCYMSFHKKLKIKKLNTHTWVWHSSIKYYTGQKELPQVPRAIFIPSNSNDNFQFPSPISIQIRVGLSATKGQEEPFEGSNDEWNIIVQHANHHPLKYFITSFLPKQTMRVYTRYHHKNKGTKFKGTTTWSRHHKAPKMIIISNNLLSFVLPPRPKFGILHCVNSHCSKKQIISIFLPMQSKSSKSGIFGISTVQQATWRTTRFRNYTSSAIC